jgi:SAM-dependent methyltransferase
VNAGGVAASNAEQVKAWDGDEGETWTRWESHFERAVAAYDAHLAAAAAVTGGDKVLDVGCGCGVSTRVAARRAVRGVAVGVDLSERMLERARERCRAEGLANARFEQADAQVHAFQPAWFDVAVSRFGAMFFADPIAAFMNIGAALRRGGRMALLTWQPLHANEWVSALRDALAAGRALPEPVTGAPGPFGLADPDATRSVLEHAGFERIAVRPVSEPLWMGADAADAYRFVSDMGMVRGLLSGLDEVATTHALGLLRASLAAHFGREGVAFGSAAWLITAQRQ